MPRARKPQVDDFQSTSYGDRAELMELNQAAPPAQSGQQQPSRPFVGTDEVPNMSDPSSRPDEPVTSGLASGPGPGPEAIGPQGGQVRRTLQAMLLHNPDNNTAMRMLEMLDDMGQP